MLYGLIFGKQGKKMKDYCKYVDVFYGSGEITEFPDSGIASKWFYIKALCGNTTPNAVLPFGKMSVGAYSGGYPTGYGTHYPNSCGGIRKMWDKMKIKGFSHIHQSGTGAIGCYYNYALAVPFYGDISEVGKYRDVNRESAKPGEYSAELDGISASLTVGGDTAFHSYRFSEAGGRVAVDFSLCGLSEMFEEKYRSRPEKIELYISGQRAFFKARLYGVTLYFCVKAEGKNVRGVIFHGDTETALTELKAGCADKKTGVVFDFDGTELFLKCAYSTVGFQAAGLSCDSLTASFEDTAKKAYEKWNGYLSAIDIKTEDESLKRKLYSCLYHSLIKPSILTGENVLGVKGDTVTDLATLWDQYKTLLPLIYLLYKDEGGKIADGIVNISRALGKIPCSFGLSDVFPCENQAKMLGIITLCDAFYAGLANESDITECMKRELERDEIKQFIETGFFERYTHILDVTDACDFVSEITEDEELKKRLCEIRTYRKNAYGKDGILSESSNYYEGDRYTYSFRLGGDMRERIAFSGGEENFAKQLDSFFGFGKDSLTQVTTADNPGKIIAEKRYHRFEGFNNECDMETPFAYIFCKRHERLCEIADAAVNVSFKQGRGAIPGNNDSGGLSSCFVWLALGLFPYAGKGKTIFSCPQIKEGSIRLNNGKILKIEVQGEKSGEYRVKDIFLNGEKIENYMTDTVKLLDGGTLLFIIENGGN